MNGFRTHYELSSSGAYELSGTAVELIEYLLRDCTPKELQELKSERIPAVQTQLNVAAKAGADRAAARAAELKRQFLSRVAQDVPLPRVVWSDELEAEARAQGQDGPALTEYMLDAETGELWKDSDRVEITDKPLAPEDQPTERVAVNADPAQYAAAGE